MKVTDLTMPFHPHWRWPVSVETAKDFAPGQPFHITRIASNVHAFTHVDAPLHVKADGHTVDAIPVQRLVGPAAIIDLSSKGVHEAIDAKDLEKAGGHVREGEMVLLRTSWDKRYSYDSKEYWTEACYVTDEAANWLFERKPTAVGFDFPQDLPLRNYSGHSGAAQSNDRLEDFATHNLLLRRGIIMIEYLVNLHRIESPRPELFALPLLIEGSEGAPARVVAVER